MCCDYFNQNGSRIGKTGSLNSIPHAAELIWRRRYYVLSRISELYKTVLDVVLLWLLANDGGGRRCRCCCCCCEATLPLTVHPKIIIIPRATLMSALSRVTLTLVAAELTSIEVWRAREVGIPTVDGRDGHAQLNVDTPPPILPPMLLRFGFLSSAVAETPCSSDTNGRWCALTTGNGTAAATAAASLGGALYRRTPLSRSSAGSTAPSATSAPRSGPCSGSPAQPPGSLGT